MEFPAASPLRGHVPLLGLLVAVFLLTYWIPPTTAGFAIVSTFAIEGQDVILRLRNTPPDVIKIIWYRRIEMNDPNFIGSRAWNSSEYLTGPEYSGREEINLEGSLIIRNVTLRDQGVYIVVAVLPKSPSIRGFGWLRVHRTLSGPTLLASNTTVTENEDAVVLTCYTNGNDINWLFNTMNLPLRERMNLSQDHRTLTIDPVRREDAGIYHWPVSVPTLLASNTTVTENEDAVVLTCYTDERSTNWLFNAMSLQLSERMKLSQDNRILTIDPVRREDAGNYQCKVSNPISSTESAPVELYVKY
ncbi:cell adhesion molecule CEACAM1-like [Myotis yumanensis]|uniref:cell adhesion molecule CEACAM1-like n=1 Tax=Myotis yumanensis TaxID=159337 RepID=UPI0038D48A51